MTSKFFVLAVMGLILTGCQAPAGTNNSAPPVANTNTATPKPEPAKKTAPTDLKQLAQRIVNQSAAVKEGEIVLISGIARDMELLENLVIEVEKVGGHALLTTGSEAIAKRSYAEVPEKYDSQEPKLSLALAKIANVAISVDSGETEGLLADVPVARRQARAKAGVPVQKAFIDAKIRAVNVGNDLYPTEWRAKRFEMATDAFSKLFWEGLNVDYTQLQTAGEAARKAIAGKEMEVTHPNGTSIKFGLEAKPAYVSDGIISADDVAKGNFDVFLPAGEVAALPAANTANGKFVIEKQFYNGKEVNKLTLNFENGKLTSYTGEGPGFEALKADYDADTDASKNIFSFVDIGINPNLLLGPASKAGNWVSAGMVTLGTGNNVWAGGSITSTVGISGHLAGCTVKVDGRTIVDAGALKMQ